MALDHSQGTRCRVFCELAWQLLHWPIIKTSNPKTWCRWKEGKVMPDGKRKRRHSQNRAKRAWYAYYRALRFNHRFGLVA
ncbi:hypothetical protein Rcae01_01518 [Novipirellula caenicola]|uniref:Transposase DDE domain-containing protein n=1 Tax=Novipirellula caenicola TaxID=1536901 RepID=A0ABP9VLJ3_9BACT